MKQTAAYILLESEREVLGHTHFDSAVHAHSAAYFCSTCGGVWARIEVQPQCVWEVFSVPCRQHLPLAVFDYGKLPGSLTHWSVRKAFTTAMLWPATLDFFPLEVLVREFDLLVGVDSSTVRAYSIPTIPPESLSMELTERIAELRSKVIAGTVTQEELREACAALRAARTSASIVREKRKAAEAKPDGAALLAKLAALSVKN